MRNSRLVLSMTNMPLRLPWQATILLWLLLDRLHAPGWVWGAVGFLLVIVWISWLIDVCTHRNVELDSLLPSKQRVL